MTVFTFNCCFIQNISLHRNKTLFKNRLFQKQTLLGMRTGGSIMIKLLDSSKKNHYYLKSCHWTVINKVIVQKFTK